MKKLTIILFMCLITATSTLAQNGNVKSQKIATDVRSEKHLSSAILLWMRTDKPRQEGMQQFQASLMLGFTDKKTMDDFFKGDALKKLSDRTSIFCAAVHAYEIYETLTYVKEGVILLNYQK